MNWENIAGLLITGVIAAVPGTIAYLAGKKREAAAALKVVADTTKTEEEGKKISADYANQIAQTAMSLIAPFELRIALMEKRQDYMQQVTARYEEYVEYLLEGIGSLLKQFKLAGIDPCWKPEKMVIVPKPMDVPTKPLSRDKSDDKI